MRIDLDADPEVHLVAPLLSLFRISCDYFGDETAKDTDFRSQACYVELINVRDLKRECPFFSRNPL